METGKQPRNEIRLKYKKKYGILFKYGMNNKGKIYSKTKRLDQRGNENKNERTTKKVKYVGERDGVIRKAQPKKCENPKSNTDTDTTNDSICNSCTSATRNSDNNRTEKTVTDKDTNPVTTNDEGSKGKAAETEAETDANSENSKSSNGRNTSNSKSYYVKLKF